GGPDELRGETDAGERKQLHLAALPAAFDLHLVQLAHGQRPTGDQRQLAVRARRQRRDRDRDCLRRSAERPVLRARGDLLHALVRGRTPLRPATLEPEMLVDLGAERGFARDPVAAEGAVRIERVFLPELGPAAVVLEDEVDAGDAVVAVFDRLSSRL